MVGGAAVLKQRRLQRCASSEPFGHLKSHEIALKCVQLGLKTYTPGPGKANARLDALKAAYDYLASRYGSNPVWNVANSDLNYLLTDKGATEAASLYLRYLAEIYFNGEIPPNITIDQTAVFFEGYRRYDSLAPNFNESIYDPDIISNNNITVDIFKRYGQEWFFINYLNYGILLADEWFTNKYGSQRLKQYLDEEFLQIEGIRANATLGLPFAQYFEISE